MIESHRTRASLSGCPERALRHPRCRVLPLPARSPSTSLIGIGLAITSIIVMPVLFLLKYRLGKAIGSRRLVADSKETLTCAMFSVALMVRLGAFYVWRLWWINAMAALVIAVRMIRKGFEIREETEGADGE